MGNTKEAHRFFSFLFLSEEIDVHFCFCLIDVGSPLYLHPSDNSDQVLVNKLFDGNCFGSWRKSVKIALCARNKLGLIDRFVEEPAKHYSTYREWERANELVMSWLLNSVEKDIGDNLLYFHSARELWIELENRFEQNSGTQLFQLKKELMSISQGSRNIATYYIRIKKV